MAPWDKEWRTAPGSQCSMLSASYQYLGNRQQTRHLYTRKHHQGVHGKTPLMPTWYPEDSQNPLPETSPCPSTVPSASLNLPSTHSTPDRNPVFSGRGSRDFGLVFTAHPVTAVLIHPRFLETPFSSPRPGLEPPVLEHTASGPW